MDCLLCIITSKIFIANWILGIICVEYALKKAKPLAKVVEERDSKQPAFRRTDVKTWYRIGFYAGI